MYYYILLLLFLQVVVATDSRGLASCATAVQTINSLLVTVHANASGSVPEFICNGAPLCVRVPQIIVRHWYPAVTTETQNTQTRRHVEKTRFNKAR